MIPFEPGPIYRRIHDIHDQFGGQRQGGISTPSGNSYIFLFTGESGAAYGYRDDFRPDGTFWYTGEGQIGDMKWERGNAAIRDHQRDKKILLLFEYVSTGKVRLIGEATYLGHHTEQRPDRDNKSRTAIIFELAIDANPSAAEPLPLTPESLEVRQTRLWSRPLEEVRRLAVSRPPVTSSTSVRRVVTHQRSEAVRVYVLRRANGICEGCGRQAPFVTTDNRPYLEPHHIHRLADGGPDDPRAVAALCPNCHREVHHGRQRAELNAKVHQVVREKERERTPNHEMQHPQE